MGLIRYFLYCILLINGMLHTSRLKTMMYVNAAPDDIEGMFFFSGTMFIINFPTKNIKYVNDKNYSIKRNKEILILY